MQGILDRLMGGGRQAPAANGLAGKKAFKSHLSVTLGDDPYDTEAEVIALWPAAGATALVWQYTVPPQQLIHWGFGSPAFPENQGLMYFACVDEAAGFSVGLVRLVQANARETIRYVVAEVDDTQMHLVDFTTTETATPVNAREKFALPEKVEFPLIGEDSLMQIWYTALVLPVGVDAITFSIPITIYQ